MRKLIIIIIFVFSGILIQAQSQTYRNNQGANYVNGQMGSLKSSSIDWTISNSGNGIYEITAIGVGSFKVKYSQFDSQNNQYIYTPQGSANFDNNTVSKVLSSGKLSDYANGLVQDPTLGILFSEDFGLIYLLSK